jgi:acetyl esterase/lipase
VGGSSAADVRTEPEESCHAGPLYCSRQRGKTADIVYAKYGDKELRLDLYTPKPKPAGLLPGIVVIRGGGWRQGDKNAIERSAARPADDIREFPAASRP